MNTTDSSNPYAPTTVDLGTEPRAPANAARYIIAVAFLLLGIRDSLRLLTMTTLPQGITVAYDPLFVAFAVVLMLLRIVAAVAIFARWRFAWFLGMTLVGYSAGSVIVAMLARGAPSMLFPLVPALILLIPHFAQSVRSTFQIDRRKLLLGVGLLAACAIVRTLLPSPS